MSDPLIAEALEHLNQSKSSDADRKMFREKFLAFFASPDVSPIKLEHFVTFVNTIARDFDYGICTETETSFSFPVHLLFRLVVLFGDSRFARIRNDAADAVTSVLKLLLNANPYLFRKAFHELLTLACDCCDVVAGLPSSGVPAREMFEDLEVCFGSSLYEFLDVTPGEWVGLGMLPLPSKEACMGYLTGVSKAIADILVVVAHPVRYRVPIRKITHVLVSCASVSTSKAALGMIKSLLHSFGTRSYEVRDLATLLLPCVRILEGNRSCDGLLASCIVLFSKCSPLPPSLGAPELVEPILALLASTTCTELQTAVIGKLLPKMLDAQASSELSVSIVDAVCRFLGSVELENSVVCCLSTAFPLASNTLESALPRLGGKRSREQAALPGALVVRKKSRVSMGPYGSAQDRDSLEEERLNLPELMVNRCKDLSGSARLTAIHSVAYVAAAFHALWPPPLVGTLLDCAFSVLASAEMLEPGVVRQAAQIIAGLHVVSSDAPMTDASTTSPLTGTDCWRVLEIRRLLTSDDQETVAHLTSQGAEGDLVRAIALLPRESVQFTGDKWAELLCGVPQTWARLLPALARNGTIPVAVAMQCLHRMFIERVGSTTKQLSVEEEDIGAELCLTFGKLVCLDAAKSVDGMDDTFDNASTSDVDCPWCDIKQTAPWPKGAVVLASNVPAPLFEQLLGFISPVEWTVRRPTPAPSRARVCAAALQMFARGVRHGGARLLQSAAPMIPAVIAAMRDAVAEVRHAASPAIAATLRGDLTSTSGEKVSPEAQVMSALEMSVDVELSASLLVAFGQCGAAGGNTLIILLELLSAMHPGLASASALGRNLLQGVAYDQIVRLASSKSLSVKSLMESYMDRLAPVLVRDSKINELESNEAITALMNCTMEEFLRRTLPYTVPSVVSYGERAVGLLSKMLNEDPIKLQQAHMRHVFKRFMLNPNMACTPFVQQCLNTPSYWKSFVYVLLAEMMPELAADAERATEAIKVIASRLGGGAEDANVRAFLAKHYLGTINIININLTGSAWPPSPDTASVVVQKAVADKIATLNGLEKLLLLFGQDVCTVRLQVIATLSTVRQVLIVFQSMEDIKTAAFGVLLTFVKTMPAPLLGPMLSTFIVMLCSHLDRVPDKDAAAKMIKEVVSYLILERNTELKAYFQSILFLPDHPELDECRKVLEMEAGELTFSGELARLTTGLEHESWDMRRRTSVELKRLLQRSHEEMFAMVMEGNSSEIGDLVRHLFNCSRYPSSILKTRLGSCLGELGAIAPGLLQIDMTARDDVELDIDNVDLVVDLIQYLARDLGALRRHIEQERSAFAIQEILRVCQCTESSELWKRFDQDLRELISPLLNSMYSLAPLKTASREAPLCSTVASFDLWAYHWATDLMSHCQGVQAPLFVACRGVVKHNSDLAMFLLPHLVLNVVRFGPDTERESICAEILAVLSVAGKEDDVPNDAPMVMKKKRVVRTELRLMAAQAVFNVHKHLSKWLEHRKAAHLSLRMRDVEENAVDNTDVAVENLLKAIPQDILAESAFRCNANARALMHLELHTRQQMESCTTEGDKKEVLGQSLPFLQKIYAGFDEPDGIRGIFCSPSTLPEQAVAMENAARWTDALACHYQILKGDPDDVQAHSGVLDSLKNSGRCELMLAHLASIGSKEGVTESLTEYKAQAAWRLSRWDVLEDTLQPPDGVGKRCTFEQDLGRTLLAMRAGNEGDVEALLMESRIRVMGSIAAASMDAYKRAYQHIVRLMMLTDMEIIFQHRTLLNASSPVDVDRSPNEEKQRKTERERLFTVLNQRLEAVQKSARCREPILTLRCVLFGMYEERSEEQRAWLQLAESWRTSGNQQSAFNAVLQAENLGSSEAYIEKSKLLWAQGHHHQALLGIGEGLPKHKHMKGNEELVVKTADTLLLMGQWMQESCARSDDIKHQYLKVVELRPQWEGGFFYLGRYLDGLFHKMDSREGKEIEPWSVRTKRATSAFSEVWLQLMKNVLKNYGRAAVYGTEHIFQSLPRLLTIWLDFGAELAVPNSRKEADAQASRSLATANSIVMELIKRLPKFMWLLVFPQVISRICHPHSKVATILDSLILAVTKEYPQQALWQMVSLSQSTVSMRAQRAKTIFAKAKQNAPGLAPLLTQFLSLTKHLLNLANFRLDKETTKISLSAYFKPLVNKMPLDVYVPVQSALIAQLPGAHGTAHNPFPGETVTMFDFIDDVDIINSLARPRKITIVGSNGRNYDFLCKPKDDLRRDCRMMEVYTMVNKLLAKDAEARRRDLRIRTYAVVPLNEECGLIEWVPHTAGLRPIVRKLLRAQGQNFNTKHIKELYKLSDKLATFRKLCEKYKPVFHKWFLATFPEPTAWFSSRLAFSRSVAVMSMIGFVIGLGDRHGENILFDSTSGECVHVDFNCIFGKGKTFETPELVPFRLTPNMVDGLGLTGVEGVFRAVSEMTMQILRDNRDSLLSVLETFIYDPLVEWSKSRNASGDHENAEGKRILKKIVGCLAVPLTVESQVDKLITDAMRPSYLAKMFIGWAPYI